MKSFKFEKYFNAIVDFFYSVSEAFLNQNLNILAITVCSFIPTIFAQPFLVVKMNVSSTQPLVEISNLNFPWQPWSSDLAS